MTDLRDFRMPEPPLARATTAGALADRLIATTSDKLTELEGSTAPGLVLPGIHAGHVVGDDATADLLYVLGLLVECGVEQVAGIDLRSHIVDDARPARPARGRGLRLVPGRRDGPAHRRARCRPRQHCTRRVLEAATSPKTIAMLEEGKDIPPNFAVVGARCLRGVARLRGEEGADDRAFVERVRSMFGTGEGWIDDGMGAWVQYDIYTPDVYLFAEPLRADIGEPWRRGLQRVLADLDDLAQPGGAVVWGRSIGALGLAMTIELAGLAVGHEIGDEQGRWIARAGAALDELDRWFPDGVIAAHQGRATMFYRGPHRRLQMTLDVYGKLLLAASALRRHPERRSAATARHDVAGGRPADHASTPIDPPGCGPCARPRCDGPFRCSPASRPTTHRRPARPDCSSSRHRAIRSCCRSSPALPGHRSTATTPSPSSPRGSRPRSTMNPGRLTVTHRGWAPCGADADHRAAIAGHAHGDLPGGGPEPGRRRDPGVRRPTTSRARSRSPSPSGPSARCG